MNNEIKLTLDFNKTNFKGIKGPIIWRHNQDGSIQPFAYISKPKLIEEDEFNAFVEYIFQKIKSYYYVYEGI